MIITITGLPGSGNSTMAKMLAKELGYKHYSAGNMRRELATERGLTINELNKIGETESWTDVGVDNKLIAKGKSEDDFVLDAKIGEYLIPQAFKIFLKADLIVRAKRITNERRRSEPFKNFEEAEKFLTQRITCDRLRYKKYYDHDAYNENNFDFILDTTNIPIEKVFEILLKKVKEVKENI